MKSPVMSYRKSTLEGSSQGGQEEHPDYPVPQMRDPNRCPELNEDYAQHTTPQGVAAGQEVATPSSSESNHSSPAGNSTEDLRANTASARSCNSSSFSTALTCVEECFCMPDSD